MASYIDSLVTTLGEAGPRPVLRRRARERLGPVIAHTYGASEIGIVSALGPAGHDRPSRFRCAGRIRPGAEVRFRRPGGGLDPRAGAIEARSPAMAQGYRHRPVAETEHFVDCWYRTGDLGELDGEGMLRILGRTSDLEDGDLSPVDLQDTLCRQPSVRYAALVADPGRSSPGHTAWIAAAEPWPGRTINTGGCGAALATRHGPGAASAVQLLPMDQIPLTEQGKPNRPAIRAAGASAHAVQ